MKFLSVRKGASGPQKNKKKGGPLPKVYKRARPQAHKLSSLTMKQYPLLWDFIRLNFKQILTERIYESKRRIKNHRLIYKNK